MTAVQGVDFIALPVEDSARASAFYGEKLGLGRNPESSGERWVEFDTAKLTLALSRFGGALAFGVQDVAEALQFPEACDSSVCHMAFLRDPDGNALILHRRYAPYSDGSTP